MARDETARWKWRGLVVGFVVVAVLGTMAMWLSVRDAHHMTKSFEQTEDTAPESVQPPKMQTAEVQTVNNAQGLALETVINDVEEAFSTLVFSETNSAGDSFGLARAESGEATPALRDCADTPGCARHADAMAWLSILELTEYHSGALDHSVAGEDGYISPTEMDALFDLPDSREVLRQCLSGERACTGSEDERLTAQGVLERADRQYRDAVERMRKAADLGSAVAQNEIGTGYLEAELGLPRDDALAERYLGLAVAQEDPYAMYGLAKLVKDGRASAEVEAAHDVDTLLGRAYELGYADVAPILVRRLRDAGRDVPVGLRITAKNHPAAEATLDGWDAPPPD